jgi:hypothetical protein
MAKEFVVGAEELKALQESASVSNAIRDLASILTGRADDVPHRFRGPRALREFFNPDIPNQTYQYATNIRGNSSVGQYDQQQIIGTNNSQMPLILRITTRPAQNILELEFDDNCGSRLFTLEIEYGE